MMLISCAWVLDTQAQEMHLELSIGNVIDNIVGLGQLDKVNYRNFINITRMPDHSKYGNPIDFNGKTYPNLISQRYTEISLGYRFHLNPEE